MNQSSYQPASAQTRATGWNVLELFAGIGGMALGLERAGMTPVGFVEIDPYCRRVLTKHWPDVPQHDDVRTAREWWASEPRPAVDVVAGGYPCQGESAAGLQRGTDDERWLWPEMARVIHTLRPRWVIGENVAGHRTQGLRFVLRDLATLGYTARAGYLEARQVGANHIRKRIFVLAHAQGLGRGQGGSGGPAGLGAYGGGQPAEVLGHAQRAGRQLRTGAQRVGAGEPEPTHPGAVLADPEREGRRPGSGLGPGGQTPVGTGWWAAEPDVARMAHGVSRGVDRRRALGNAIVPQCAERIGAIITAVDQELSRGR